MTREQLEEWRAFCEWLSQRRRKCAYRSEVPEEWSHLVYVGGNPTGERAREARRAARLIFYQAGWGYRLRKNWRERLAELEASL